VPEPATFDARHEAFCRDEEIRREGLRAYCEQLDTEDLVLNLRLSSGAEREVMGDVLEGRGVKAAANQHGTSVVSMSHSQLFDHFRALSNDDLLEACDTLFGACHEPAVRSAICYEVAYRWRQTLPVRPCDCDLETVDVLAVQERTRPTDAKLFEIEERQRVAIKAEDEERDRKTGNLCPRCKGWKSKLLASCGQCMADMENELSEHRLAAEAVTG
jgi:hypothetical protein